MNTLDDLRATLGARAHDPDGGLDATTRGAQVRDRVRSVRRRRTASTAAAAAAAVIAVAVAAVSVVPGSPAPGPAEPRVPRELAGHVVPPTIEAAGWTYQFEESVTGRGRAEVELDESDQPRLVAWAAQGDAPPGTWQVTPPDGESLPAASTGFDEWRQVPAGPGGSFSISGPAQDVALAVYELSDERPEGITSDGFTFRSQVAGDALVAAATARGRSTVVFDLPIPDGTLRFGGFCAGSVEGAQLHLRIDGRPAVTTGCSPTAYFDPGGSWTAVFTDGIDGADGEPLRVGDVVRAELSVTDAQERPVRLADDAVIGGSFYELAPPAATLADQPVPELVEFDAMTWELSGTVGNEAGSPAEVTLDGTRPWLTYAYFARVGDATVYTTVDGRRTGARFQSDATTGDLGGAGGPIHLPAGGRVTVGVEGGIDPRARLGLAVYRRVG